MPWRPLHDDGGGAPTLEALIRGLFDLRALVDYLRTCVTFEADERGEIAKKIANYHQFRVVRKARASVLARLKPPSGTGDGRGGAIWHTQGSGQVADHVDVGRGADPRVAHDQPDDRHDHRPQRSGRSALRHLCRRARAASAGPGPGREPGASQGAARPRGGRGGLIVDLLGLADQLADALATYSQAGGTGEAVRNVQNEAVPAMQAAFEKLRGFFHGCDYKQALDTKPQAVLLVYLRAIDHVFGQNDGWKRLRTLVKELSAAFALAVPRPETDAITPHLAFFQRVVAMIRKRLSDDIGSGAGYARQRDIDAAVRR